MRSIEDHDQRGRLINRDPQDRIAPCDNPNSVARDAQVRSVRQRDWADFDASEAPGALWGHRGDPTSSPHPRLAVSSWVPPAGLTWNRLEERLVGIERLRSSLG